MRFIVFLASVLSVSFLTEGTGHACGALVTNEKSVVVQSQQRVLISLRADGSSKIVVQLGIPEASAPFGAITPVGGQPTLDPEPVDTEELDGLERTTRPTVRAESAASDSGGCGCGSAEAGDAAGGKGFGNGGVNVVQIVDIGPVTAAALAADTTAALTGWLGDNGFVVPAADQPVIDSYVGPNKFFIAFKRSNQAAAGPSSVGVSFSVPGDQRGYPLRISRVGADSRLGIQVFVAAPEVISPTGSAPAGNFQTLTLADFSAQALYDDYTGTLFSGIAQKGGKAFVVEGVFAAQSGWRGQLGPKLIAITESGQVLSRLATVVAPAQLTEDVSFTGNAPKDVPRDVMALWLPLGGPGRGEQHRDLYLAVCGLGLVAWSLRRSLRPVAAPG
ncbi:MAG: DUF2330 domain-containing protein [Myxococcales bacterium]|nr:DUF2330 domain-containing protein [Myxococcales bacterium]